MQVGSDFRRFDKDCAQTRPLQCAQLFGDTFFIGKVLLAPGINSQLGLNEASEKKYRQDGGCGDAHESAISQYSFCDDRKNQAESWNDRLDIANFPEVEENFDRYKCEANERDFPSSCSKMFFFPKKNRKWRSKNEKAARRGND